MASVTKRSAAEMAKIWVEFERTHDASLKNILAEEYYPIVRYTAERMIERLPHNVQVEDLVGAGVFGLLDAIEKFDQARGVKFETYCVGRIRGSMLDELRAMDWVPRLTRARANKLEAAYAKLEREHGRAPTDHEVAKELGISVDELDSLHREVSGASLLSLQHRTLGKDEEAVGVEVMEDEHAPLPLSESSKKDFVEYCKKKLSTKERNVLMLYYYEELTFKEIGEVLNISESRVCQLHTKLVARLRGFLKGRQDDVV
jgi:RNA polymerase sigma factor for flagellar operon FliA